MYETLGIIAGILALGGYIPYIYTTIKGSNRPNKATWFIWTLVGGLLAFSYMSAGDKNAIWVPLGYFIGPLIVAILSMRYGYSEWTKFDTFCVVAAVISLVPWFLSNDATITLLINVMIDATGALPTIIKTYREPESEDFVSWLIFFIANTLEVIAISNWDLSAVYPFYLFFLAGSITLLSIKDKVKEKYLRM